MRRGWKWGLPWVGMLALSFGAIGCDPPTSQPTTDPLAGLQPTQALTHPAHVEAYRVGPLKDHPGFGGKVEGYAALETGAMSPQRAADISRMALALLDHPAAPKDPTFAPTVAWRFYHQLDGGAGQESVDLVVCLECNQALFVWRDTKNHEQDRKIVGLEETQPYWMILAEQCFPNDTDLNGGTTGIASTMPSP